MSTDPRLNRAAVAIALPGNNGTRTFHMKPFTDRFISEIDAELRTRLRTEIAEMAALLPTAAAAALANDNLKALMNISFMDGGRGSEMIGTVEGIITLMWYSFHESEQSLTREELRQYAVQSDGVKLFIEEWKALNLSRRSAKASSSVGEL